MTNENLDKHQFKSEKFSSVVQEAVEFALSTPKIPLKEVKRFSGTGVYILYYTGDFDAYAFGEIELPIYVGKAVPGGWRQGRRSGKSTYELFRRISEHRSSIRQVSNLDVEHFSCRFVILADAETDLIVPLEAELIRVFRPLWNSIIDGFGNHDPGKGRYAQALSEWDALHPGRSWAERLTGEPPTKEKIIRKLKEYFESLKPS